MVDNLFDSLNVRNYQEAKLKRKPFLSPYRNGDDWRLKVIILRLIYYQSGHQREQLVRNNYYVHVPLQD
jgi:hypothetical protein